jgi:hypothetical protein
MWPVLPLLLLAAPALAQPGDQQRDGVAAWRALREGRILSIREIEKRVVPTMKDAQYIGFDFEMPSAVYTLKFLRDGTVVWVDVDGRSGQVIGRTGK